MTTNKQPFTTHLIVVDEEEERESTDPTVEEPDRLFNQTVRPLNPKKGDFTTRHPPVVKTVQVTKVSRNPDRPL